MKAGVVVGVLCGLSTVACSGLPSVTYTKYAGAPTSAADINRTPATYQLWTTALEFKKTSSGVMTVTAQAVPVSSNPFSFAIAGDHHWYSTTTTVSLATASDSELLSSVAVNVTDNRSTYIGIAAEVLSVGAKVGKVGLLDARPEVREGCHANKVPAAQSPDAGFDEVFNILDAITTLDGKEADCSQSNQQVAFVLGNANDGVGDLALVQLDPPPATAIALSDANVAILVANAKNVFLYPACRTGTVRFNTQAPPARPAAGAAATASAAPMPFAQTTHFLFSDPRYVQAVAMPAKGTLTVKAQCGMTAGTDSGNADATAAIAKALADGLQTLNGGAANSNATKAKTNATSK